MKKKVLSKFLIVLGLSLLMVGLVGCGPDAPPPYRDFTEKTQIQEVKEESFVGGYLGVSVFGRVKKSGLSITGVDEDSPAAGVGLQKRDMILAIDGKKVDYVSDLRKELLMHNPGDKVTLTISRDGEKGRTDVILGTIPER